MGNFISSSDDQSKAATLVQANYRGHAARKEVSLKMKGIVEMRTNTPSDWTVDKPLPGGFELMRKRHLSFAEGHLVVAKMQDSCCGGDAVGGADFVVEITKIKRVSTDPKSTLHFAIGVDGERDRLFRAATQKARDDWVKALTEVSARPAKK